jgi:hypothetical protein
VKGRAQFQSVTLSSGRGSLHPQCQCNDSSAGFNLKSLIESTFQFCCQCWDGPVDLAQGDVTDMPMTETLGVGLSRLEILGLGRNLFGARLSYNVIIYISISLYLYTAPLLQESLSFIWGILLHSRHSFKESVNLPTSFAAKEL